MVVADLKKKKMVVADLKKKKGRAFFFFLFSLSLCAQT